MALQSQTLRSNGARASSSSMSRSRKPGNRRLVGMALLVLVLGGGFIALIRYRGGDTSSPLAPQGAKAAGVTLPAPSNTPTPAPQRQAAAPTPTPAPEPAPTVLDMGSRPRKGDVAGTSSRTDVSNSLAVRPSESNAASPSPSPTPASGAAAPAVRDPLTTIQVPGASTPMPQSSMPSAAPASTTPAAASPQQPQAPASDTAGLPGELAAVQTLAERMIGEKKYVEARAQLNKILVDPRVSEKDRDGIRKWMSDLNDKLVFSAMAYPGDPFVDTYTVAKGDNPIKISQKVNSVTEAGFIQRVNGFNPKSLAVGQQLKIVKGPFHAVVSKSAFRMDIYAGPTPSPASIGSSGLGAGAEPGWVYIRSFPVGLGEKGVTPLGAFTVKDNSKLINPPWVNPRTGEKFDKDDPKNPIGERWVGLVGLDEKTKSFTGYGIHGTIVPESIGKEMSMGCVRMNAADVEIVYDMLMGRVSVVKIVP